MRRLEHAERDLTRLEDVIGEVETKVRSLARQKGKAERYKTLRDRRLAVEVSRRWQRPGKATWIACRSWTRPWTGTGRSARAWWPNSGRLKRLSRRCVWKRSMRSGIRREAAEALDVIRGRLVGVGT